MTGCKPQTLFNYAVKFSPRCPSFSEERGRKAKSSGTDGIPQSGRVRMEDVPGGARKLRISALEGEPHGTLFSLFMRFVFCLQCMKRKQDNISEQLLSYRE